MRNRSKRPKRIIAAALTTLFLSHQTLMLSVVASEITGVTGNNGVYNIDPSALIKDTDIGYRKYKNFNLDKNDIANLIFKYGDTDISTFVNLVDNQININGLVNSMRNGNFYNGKAIFISPNGMIVGASGVINVGSLGVYTPSNEVYERYKNNPTANLNGITSSNNGKPITINGKVLVANDVTLSGGKVTLGQNAGIIAGINESQMAQITANDQANALFTQLVNTDNLNMANAFSSDNGNVYITTNQTTENAGVDIQGDIRNFGKGNIEIRNVGADGINVSGNIANANGLVKLNNNWGDLNISGSVKNNGTTQIFNVPAEGSETKFTVDGVEYSYTIDANSGLNITGNIDTKGTTTITNTGTKGLNISGKVKHDGTLSIQNGVAGDRDAAKARNAQMTGLNITGTVDNIGGTTDITNYAANGLNVSGTVASNGDLTMTNTGAKGLNIESTGRVNGNSNITTNNNGKDGTNIKGLVNAKKNVNINNQDSNVTIGDNTTNEKYVTAGNDINIIVTDGSILNYGVDKV